MTVTLQSWIQSQLPGISLKSAESVLALTSEGATLPFIARYRKEQTGNLDEVKIQTVDRREGALGHDHPSPDVHRRTRSRSRGSSPTS